MPASDDGAGAPGASVFPGMGVAAGALGATVFPGMGVAAGALGAAVSSGFGDAAGADEDANVLSFAASSDSIASASGGVKDGKAKSPILGSGGVKDGIAVSAASDEGGVKDGTEDVGGGGAVLPADMSTRIPQLSQKTLPASSGAPHAGQVISPAAIAAAGTGAVFFSDPLNVLSKWLSLRMRFPHSRQKMLSAGFISPQFGHLISLI